MNTQENQDQSISEEEGLEDSWKEDAMSLSCAPNNYEGAMPVISQLEMLKDHREIHRTNDEHISSHARKMGFYVDDEVENPSFSEDDDFVHHPRINSSNRYNEVTVCLPTMASISHSNEETISDNEKISCPTLKSAKEDVSSKWSEASLEVKELICLHENSGCSSSHGVSQKAYKACKGGVKAKSKRKFTFHFQPCKEDLPLLGGDGSGWPLLEKIAFPNATSAAVHKDMDKVMVENRLVVGEEVELLENHIAPFELSRQHDFKESSMAESLVQFHERSVLILGSSEMGYERKGVGEHTVLDKYKSPAGEECLNVDDLPEALDSGPSSDDEAFLENHQNMKSIIPRTMADQFHEAFGTVSVNDEAPHLNLCGPLYDGLFKKLQRVIQIAKEKDLAQLKISNAKSNSLDERAGMTVRILSRSLEAKLTVCSCASIGDGEDTLLNSLQMTMRNAERTLTIIFSSRMCSNVNLEVGNIICLHPPCVFVFVCPNSIYIMSLQLDRNGYGNITNQLVKSGQLGKHCILELSVTTNREGGAGDAERCSGHFMLILFTGSRMASVDE